MTFLNPLLLLGLIAASIPLLLHLLNLRKLRTVEFSSLRFLKELQKSKMRRMRLRQILLLILRTLLVVFAVIAFARPALQSTSGLPGAHAATSAVILIDNSYSMEVKEEGGTRLAAARRGARQVVDILEENDQAWIVPMTDPGREIGEPPTRNHDQLVKRVDSLPAAFRRADLDESLRAAAAILDNTETLNREVYILTDAQRANVQSHADSLKIFTPETRIFVMPIGNEPDRPIPNLGLDSIRVLSSVFEVGKPVEITAWIQNYGRTDVENVPVTATLNGGPGGTATATIPAGKSVAVDITVAPRESGPQAGYVELAADALVADNRRYFAFPVSDRLRVALLGSPDALRFLSLAFSVLGETIDARALPPGSVGAVDMTETSTIVIADAVVPDADRIAAFVEGGGGLVIYGGPGLDRNAFNSGLGARLGIALGATVVPPKSGSTGFASLDREHPLFAGVFDPTRQGTVYEAPVIRQSIPSVGGQSIIRTAWGTPFMSEHRWGKGKIIYIAVPPTNAWSDLPSRGIFLPLAIRSVLYVGSRSNVYPSVTVGENVTMPIQAKGPAPESVTIVRPDGREEIVPVRSYPSGATVAYDRTDARGVYKVIDRGRTIALFTANMGSGESQLEAMSDDELERTVASRMVNRSGVTILNSDKAGFRDAVVASRFGLELWKYALGLAIICAFAEMFVARTAVRE